MTLVSVCVTTYNHAAYIRECLDSILMQKTDFGYEVLLGEDGSTDGTRDICIEYAAKYPDKIRLFLRDRKDVIYINGNPSGRFNMIENLRSANGEFIALCEGDDYWTDPLKLQKQVEALRKNPDCSICFHSARVKYEDVSKLEHVSNQDQKRVTTIADLSMGNYINTATCIFRNHFKGNMPSWYYSISVGDWPLHLLNAQYGSILFLDEPMAVYRIHPSSIWGNQSKQVMYDRILSMLYVLKQEFPQQYKIFFERSCSTQYMNLSSHYQQLGEKWKSFSYFYKACKSSDLYSMTNKDILHKLRTIFFGKK